MKREKFKKKLDVYRSSPLNIIDVKWGEERIKFNLFEELQISTVIIEKELKSQPSHYGFLLMLHKKLTTRFMELKEERKSLRAKLYRIAKAKRVENGRYASDDDARAYVESNKKYMVYTKACIFAKDQADQIYAAVKAYEQRASLLQTISSNRRKES